MQDLLKMVKMNFGGWGSNPMAKQIDITVLVQKCNNGCFFWRITSLTTPLSDLIFKISIDRWNPIS